MCGKETMAGEAMDREGREALLTERKTADIGVPVYQTYKDRVFRMLFSEKGRLLELYNALNGTAYDRQEDLTVNTLENAIYIKMKNDVSFIIDCNMYLYEHQSTYCPNMPLRGLLYFADLYKKQFKEIDLSTRKQIKIPTPHYIVFYNGLEKKEEEFIQKLSDSFEKESAGSIEITVRFININFGHNKELLNKCKTLYDYAYFVAKIRKKQESMELQQAVETTVEECIREGILKDFLLEQKAEVVAMSIYEYNEEYIRKSMLEEGKEEGREEGREEEKIKGKKALIAACEELGISYEKTAEKLKEKYFLSEEEVQTDMELYWNK